MLKNVFALPLALLAGCVSTLQITMEPEDGVDFLADCLTGTFESAALPAADPDGSLPTRLSAQVIWTERADGPWISLEQASLARLERPYRQRVHRISATASGYRSELFELPTPASDFAGQPPAAFESLEPTDLTLLAGCAIDLDLIALDGSPAFAGSTTDKDCSNSHAGSAYATTRVTIGNDFLELWERGFDAKHNQVWGAASGPIHYERLRGTFP